MRAVVLALALAPLLASAASIGCAAAAERVPVTPPRDPPVVVGPVAVAKVIQRVAKGVLKEDSPFVVVLTRPVNPVPHALALVDDDLGTSIDGETVWLDRQVVAFYPTEPLAPGLALHLRLAVALHAKDGSSIEPSELASGETVVLESSPHSEVRSLGPMQELTLGFDRGIAVAELESLGQLTDASGRPIPFVARSNGASLAFISSPTAFPPGASMVFAWKSGPIAKTSVGRTLLHAVRASVKKGLWFEVGEYAERCAYLKNTGEATVLACKSDVAHIVFSAPIAKSEIAKHVHPALPYATSGDVRGHRLEIALGKKPIAIELDAKLEDVFGQRTSYASKFMIQKAH